MWLKDPVPMKHKFTIGDRVVLNQLIASHDKYNHRLLNYFGQEGKINTIHYNDKKLLYYTVEFQTDNVFCGFALEDIPEEWLAPAKKYWSGKVVCVKSEGRYNYFTEGKVYTVLDGEIFGNNGNKYNQKGDHRMESSTDCATDYYKFIEFKGE